MTAAEETKAVSAPVEKVKSLLQSPQIKARFEEVLGKRSAGFMSSIISAVNANKQLQECEPITVISAAAVAAALDLPITPGLGFAHIVPYKGKAQFQIGWKGFVQLALRSAQYKTINLTPVLDGQLKSLNSFTGEIELVSESRSPRQVGYLLYFKLLNGYEKYFYMTREEVEAHAKRYSASYKKGFGVWVDNFEAMALKTVCKLGLSKFGPLSIEMQRALETDQAELNENGEPKYVDNTIEVGATAEAPAAVQNLNKKISGSTTKPDITTTAKPVEAEDEGGQF